MDAIRYLIVGGLIVYMTYSGFVRSSSGFLSWPMYVGRDELPVLNQCQALDRRSGRAFAYNIYEAWPVGDFLITIGDLGQLVEYLNNLGIEVFAHGAIYGDYGEGALEVEGTYVVTYLPT